MICICGIEFIPNNPRNTRCWLCSGNYKRVRRFKEEIKRHKEERFKALKKMTMGAKKGVKKVKFNFPRKRWCSTCYPNKI